MSKHYIIDTNVLLYDPTALYAFEDNNVYISFVVLEELDHKKKSPNDVGANARAVVRELDKLRQKGRLCDGIELDNGGKLFVKAYDKAHPALDASVADNKIIAVGKQLQDEFKDEEVILVSRDLNVRIKADTVRLDAQDYESSYAKEHYRGFSQIFESTAFVDKIYKDHFIEVEMDACDNQYFLVQDHTNSSHRAYTKYRDGRLILIECSRKIASIGSKNDGQKFLIDALLDPTIKLVTVSGKAGTGKTLLSVAAGVQQILTDDIYDKMVITRPVVPVGRDIGFLPGNIQEKLEPWMKPIYDAIDLIVEGDRKPNKKSEIPATFNSEEYIQIAPLNYIRGRSLHNRYIIVDESQNLTPHEVKTIITRAGQNTKIILTGDVDQIDCPYLNSESNGLSTLISKFKGEDLYAHITLVDGERSELAELAANIL
jgi:PhoH-like ATPase